MAQDLSREPRGLYTGYDADAPGVAVLGQPVQVEVRVAGSLVGHWLMFKSRLIQEPFNLEVFEVGDTQGFTNSAFTSSSLTSHTSKRLFYW